MSGNYKRDWWVYPRAPPRGEWKPAEWQVNKHFPPLAYTPVTLESVLAVTTRIHSQHARWISSDGPYSQLNQAVDYL